VSSGQQRSEPLRLQSVEEGYASNAGAPSLLTDTMQQKFSVWKQLRTAAAAAAAAAVN
jgi:hypothetical protein